MEEVKNDDSYNDQSLTDNSPVKTNEIVETSNSESANTAQTMSQLPTIEILGAVKVKDGLFLGDEFASQDLEFVIANKVTHIINCAGRQVFNQWTAVGVKYLSFYWLDDDRQLLFDDHDQVAKEIHDFIEEAVQDCNGVLVHSVRGQSRSCCVLSIYLMMKFKWTLLKALEYINSRRPNLEIRASFLQQLSQWERRVKQVDPKRTDDWNELLDSNPTPQNEELLLRNTFMNAQMQPVNYMQQWKEDMLNSFSGKYKVRLRWLDNSDDTQQHKLITNDSKLDLIHQDEELVKAVKTHKIPFNGKRILKIGASITVATKNATAVVIQKENKLPMQNEVKPKQQQQLITESSNAEQRMQTETDQSIEQSIKSARKRPITPLIKKRDTSNLIQDTPDNKGLRHYDDRGNGQVGPKRSNSIKRLDPKEKKDKYKAKVAWAVNSPKDKNIIINQNKDTEKSPRQGSTIFKKDLLEKAKKSLMENAKLNVGLDIKKIQETLNKITNRTGLSNQTNLYQGEDIQQQQRIQTDKVNGNIINSNNINIYYQEIQSKQLPIQQQQQAPIGQYHHKRANSGSQQIAQQIKKQGGYFGGHMHRKNQMSEVPSAIRISNTTDNNSYFNNQSANLHNQSKKDFKQMIKDLQKDTMNSMTLTTQQKQLKQAHQLKQGIINQYAKQQVLVPQKKRNNSSHTSSHQELVRPSSAKLKQPSNKLASNSSSANNNRKLRKSNEYLLGNINGINNNRRSQTPMPQSPDRGNGDYMNLAGGSGAGANRIMGLGTSSATNLPFHHNNSVRDGSQRTKKRTKSPSLTKFKEPSTVDLKKQSHQIINQFNNIAAGTDKASKQARLRMLAGSATGNQSPKRVPPQWGDQF